MPDLKSAKIAHHFASKRGIDWIRNDTASILLALTGASFTEAHSLFISDSSTSIPGVSGICDKG